jgi:hypothetical protein
MTFKANMVFGSMVYTSFSISHIQAERFSEALKRLWICSLSMQIYNMDS